MFGCFDGTFRRWQENRVRRHKEYEIQAKERGLQEFQAQVNAHEKAVDAENKRVQQIMNKCKEITTNYAYRNDPGSRQQWKVEIKPWRERLKKARAVQQQKQRTLDSYSHAYNAASLRLMKEREVLDTQPIREMMLDMNDEDTVEDLTKSTQETATAILDTTKINTRLDRASAAAEIRMNKQLEEADLIQSATSGTGDDSLDAFFDECMDYRSVILDAEVTKLGLKPKRHFTMPIASPQPPSRDHDKLLSGEGVELSVAYG